MWVYQPESIHYDILFVTYDPINDRERRKKFGSSVKNIQVDMRWIRRQPKQLISHIHYKNSSGRLCRVYLTLPYPWLA